MVIHGLMIQGVEKKGGAKVLEWEKWKSQRMSTLIAQGHKGARQRSQLPCLPQSSWNGATWSCPGACPPVMPQSHPHRWSALPQRATWTARLDTRDTRQVHIVRQMDGRMDGSIHQIIQVRSLESVQVCVPLLLLSLTKSVSDKSHTGEAHPIKRYKWVRMSGPESLSSVNDLMNLSISSPTHTHVVLL